MELQKSNLIGLRVSEVIVSIPNEPVSMSAHTYSQGFLIVESGLAINLGAFAPPLLAVTDQELKKVKRDFRAEEAFTNAIGQLIVGIRFPDESVYDFLEIQLSDKQRLTYINTMFWSRPILDEAPQIQR